MPSYDRINPEQLMVDPDEAATAIRGALRLTCESLRDLLKFQLPAVITPDLRDEVLTLEETFQKDLATVRSANRNNPKVINAQLLEARYLVQRAALVMKHGITPVALHRAQENNRSTFLTFDQEAADKLLAEVESQTQTLVEIVEGKASRMYAQAQASRPATAPEAPAPTAVAPTALPENVPLLALSPTTTSTPTLEASRQETKQPVAKTRKKKEPSANKKKVDADFDAYSKAQEKAATPPASSPEMDINEDPLFAEQKAMLTPFIAIQTVEGRIFRGLRVGPETSAAAFVMTSTEAKEWHQFDDLFGAAAKSAPETIIVMTHQPEGSIDHYIAKLKAMQEKPGVKTDGSADLFYRVRNEEKERRYLKVKFIAGDQV